MSTSDYPAQSLSRPRLPRLRAAVSARAVSADVWAVAGLIVIAAAIRVLVINNQSYWTDEALTAYEARLPLGAMLNTVAHVETTPPLYFLLAWVWAHIFGNGEVALRSISTLAGIALVPVAYLCGRELVSRWTGLLAATFVTVNPFLIWYSQEARSYMLLGLLSACSLLWFIRTRREASRRNILWWAVFSSLAVMTHFFAGYLVAAEAVWLLWVHRIKEMRIAVGAVAVVEAVMLPLAFIDTSHGPQWISTIPRVHRIGDAVLEWGVSVLFRRGTLLQALFAGVLMLGAVLLLLVLSRDRVAQRGAIVAGSLAAFVLLAPLALGLVGQDYFLSRNEMPAFMPVLLVVTAALAARRTRAFGGALALVLLAVFTYATIHVQTAPSLQRPNWRSAAHALGPSTVPRAIISTGGTSADPLKIYMSGINWTLSHSRRVRIREVDVLGLPRPQPLALGPVSSGLLAVGVKIPIPLAPPLPRVHARGTRLISIIRVHQWLIARYALPKPMLVSSNQLEITASRFFQHIPQGLLIFFQPAGRPVARG